jgi:hypothetical protein
MSSEYAGSPVMHATITVLDDLDFKNAASVAVPLQQLKDCIAALGAGVGLSFTDATLHGNTTFPDGTIGATVTSMSLVASGAISLASTAGLLFLGGNAFEVGSTTTVLIGAGTDMTINVGDDLTVDVNGDAAIDVAGNLVITGADAIDLLAGRVLIDATHIELADDVTLGGGTGDTVSVAGTLAANHNATFAAAKTVTMSGVTTAADLRATVKNVAGITLQDNGQIKYRIHTIVDGDFGGGYYVAGSYVADVFECDALTADGEVRMDDSLAPERSVIEFSFKGMTGGHTVTIKDATGVTTLLTCTASSNCSSRWRKKASGWRLLTANDS